MKAVELAEIAAVAAIDGGQFAQIFFRNSFNVDVEQQPAAFATNAAHAPD